MSLFRELRRRNVFRVAISYLVLAWLVIQVTAIAVPALHLPHWVNTLVFFFGAIGFPFALLFAWAFELTPEGIKPVKQVHPEQSIAPLTGRKLDFLIIALLVLGLILLLIDRLRLSQQIAETHQQTPAVAATDDASASSPTAPVHEQQPRIAVLPFVNMSPDKSQDYFSDGITEELLNLLARTKGLRVTGRTSSFAFKGINQDLREIGQQLGVDYLLEGSVRKQDANVRITAQLIRTEDGFHLWSETYDRELADIFALQDEIGLKITRALRLNLLGEASYPQPGQVSVEAHNLYLLGLKQLHLGTYHALVTAGEHFRQAIAISPDYVDAHEALLRSINRQIGYGVIAASAGSEAIKVQLDVLDRLGASNRPRVMAYRALYEFMHLNQEASALARINAAYQQAPHDLEVIQLRAFLLNYSNQHQEALRLTQLAHRLDPLNPHISLQLAKRQEDNFQFDQAMTTLDKLARLHPEYASVYFTRGLLLMRQGQYAEALRVMLRHHHKDPQDSEWPAMIALALVQMGLTEPALGFIQQADTIKPDAPLTLAVRAVRLWRLGQPEQAQRFILDHLQDDNDSRFGSAQIMRTLLFSLYLDESKFEALESLIYATYPRLRDYPFASAEQPLGYSQLAHAVWLAVGKQQAGHQQQARALATAVLAQLDRHANAYSVLFKAYVRVSLLPILHRTHEAMTALYGLHQQSSLSFEYYQGKGLIDFYLLRDHPPYQRLLARLEQDMLAQQAQALEHLSQYAEQQKSPL